MNLIIKFDKYGYMIRSYRKNILKLSQNELADLLGITRQSLSNIERNKFIPSLELAYKFAILFNVSIEQLFFIQFKKV